MALVTALLVTIGGTAEAAVLFSDNFEDGNANGWSKTNGSWSVVSDVSYVYRQGSTGADARAIAGAGSGNGTSVSARVKPIAFRSGGGNAVSLLSTAGSLTSYYYVALRSSNTIEVGKRTTSGLTALGSASFTVTPGTWYTLTLNTNLLASGQIIGSVAGGPSVTVTDSSPLTGTGKVGFGTLYASASFDDVTLSNNLIIEPPTSAPPTTAGPTTGGPGPAQTGLVGFATVNAWGQNGTTGGAGGPSVTVSTAAQFIDYATRTGPYTIFVSGMISLSAMQNVSSDKTIIGLGTGSGFTGYGLNIGIPIDDAITSPPANAVKNIIIRNLVFTGSGDDAINVQMFSHHIWIDHNDLCCGYDGLIDIKRGSSYVTVSWNHTHNHSKNMLLGRDDGDTAQDTGRLKVTYHHNWFNRTPQRNPRVRFGEPVHIFNNYYVYNTDVGVACQANAGCLVEGNYFADVEEPVTNSYAGPAGRCVARNNVFVGESGSPDCSGTVQEASGYYSYTLDDPNAVKSIVSAGAGVGKIGY
ncbi:hypothetical protein GCM10009682_12070 [Luedemannella flava]|uniref:Pectate lyase domain-containing protein n=1 Tax=Luedemannella flava TaxID=349316 RepID=A0ABN2LMA4_9ACTN